MLLVNAHRLTPESQILRTAAAFLHVDQGGPDLFQRMTEAVPGSPELVSEAMNRTLRAARRAGQLSIMVEQQGAMTSETTSGATCKAKFEGVEENKAVSVVVSVEDDDGGIADLGVRLYFPEADTSVTVVTNALGEVTHAALGTYAVAAFGHPLPQPTAAM